MAYRPGQRAAGRSRRSKWPFDGAKRQKKSPKLPWKQLKFVGGTLENCLDALFEKKLDEGGRWDTSDSEATVLYLNQNLLCWNAGPPPIYRPDVHGEVTVKRLNTWMDNHGWAKSRFLASGEGGEAEEADEANGGAGGEAGCEVGGEAGGEANAEAEAATGAAGGESAVQMAGAEETMALIGQAEAEETAGEEEAAGEEEVEEED